MHVIPTAHGLRAICFDLDNTLWDVDPVIARAEAEMHAWLAAHYPAVTQRYSIEEMRAERRALMQAEPQNAHDLTYVRKATLARQAAAVGYSRDIAELAFDVFFAARHRVALYDDVKPAIALLAKQFMLATLSNGNADLTRIGIHEWFCVSAISGDIGVAKPHLRAFRHIADSLDVAPANILYVGDDPYIDVAGARAAGMRTAWIRRKPLPWPEDLPRADFEVIDCLELHAALSAR